MTLWDALPHSLLSALHFHWMGSSPVDYTLCNRIYPPCQTTYFYALLYIWAGSDFVSGVWVFLWEFIGCGYAMIPPRYYLVFPMIIIKSIIMAIGFGLFILLSLYVGRKNLTALVLSGSKWCPGFHCLVKHFWG